MYGWIVDMLFWSFMDISAGLLDDRTVIGLVLDGNMDALRIGDFAD